MNQAVAGDRGRSRLHFGIREKLFVLSLGLILVSFGVAYFYMAQRVGAELTERVQDDLLVRANLVAQDVATRRPSESGWQSRAVSLAKHTRTRVTFVSPNGAVVGDSDVAEARLAKLENHAARPEIRQALQGRTGTSQRHSSTLQKDLVYVAVPLRAEGQPSVVVRVAMPLTEVDAMLEQLRNTLTGAALVALLAAVFLSSVAAQVATKTARELTHTAERMAGGDLEARSVVDRDDEFGELSHSINRIAANLTETLDALKDERDRTAGVLEGMHEGVLLLDGDDRVVVANAAMREMLGIAPGAEGRPIDDVVSARPIRELLKRARVANRSVGSDLELAGIETRTVLARVAPIVGDSGSFLFVLIDVTDVRRLENLRREFVANVSHELRTPVAAIRSASETLLAGAIRDEQAAPQFLKMVDRNATRLQDLVEDVLDLSRIESSGFKPNIRRVELHWAVEQVFELHQARADRNEVRLVSTVDPEIAVEADERGLDHVLGNLVDNAIKYAGASTTVTVSVERRDDHVEVSVSDTGPGFEARHIERLFERFYRVDPGRSREMGGTGLGLAIVKHLVESMGGTVGADASPGEGARFFFTLPSVTPAADPAA